MVVKVGGEGSEGTEPIDDAEVLYRRIPAQPNYFSPDTDNQPSAFAFKPIEQDTTGLSLSRAKYKTPREVAVNTRGRRFYVGHLRAGEIRGRGLQIEPRPLPDDPGHCEITTLTYENRNEDASKEHMVALATMLCIKVEGPYP